MYNLDALIDPKTHSWVESPEIAVSPDRLEKITTLQNQLHDVLGYGVTRQGDRLTVRAHDTNGKLFQIEMVILEVSLARDRYVPENR